MTRRRLLTPFAIVLLALVSCGESDDAGWEILTSERAEALLAVTGTSADDVYAVGADQGFGPLVLHWDGSAWERLETGTEGAIWWAHAFADGTVFFGGSGGQILRLRDGTFERMPVPGLAVDTVFGLWGSAPDDVWAVGGVAGRAGFVWHYDGTAWANVPLPLDMPRVSGGELPGLFKVWGDPADGSVVIVGAGGTVLRGAPRGGELTVEATAHDDNFFTVAGEGSAFAAVGGATNGVIYERGADGAWVDRSPFGVRLLQGVFVAADGTGVASGAGGTILERAPDGTWDFVDPGLDLSMVQSLHAAWIDPEGGLWAVGGNVLSPELDRGILLHRGPGVPPLGDVGVFPEPPPPDTSCPEEAIDPAPEGASIARRWNEQILGAIRRDIPRPTVHARNLFHVSAAIYDTWAAYDPGVTQLFANERAEATDLEAAREEAISYAAFRVLTHRYDASRALQPGSDISQSCFRAFMEALGYDPDDGATEGEGARALGNRIGAAVIAAAADDGANEAANYADTTGYAPVSPPMVVDLPGTSGVTNPFRWQELDLAEQITQNGIPLDTGLQEYIGPNWRDVTPFAIERPAPSELYVDVGEPPLETIDDLRPFAVEVIEKTAALAADGPMIDVSPGGYGNNGLGDDEGTGHPLNPVTDAPYTAQPVPAGDFFRILAEYWADGPESETPPGHWNLIANEVSDDPRFERRLFGEGPELERLEWDVRLHLAVNGAVHDAAIVAWELKREFTSSRPITIIRYMAERGQSSDPEGPGFDPEGLPLVPGLIEVITEDSSAPGERHFHLRHFVGEIALLSWRGTPVDPDTEVGGVDWIRGVLWIPYQRETFVTPSFPGYTSGHSTFSRAAAVMLSEITGSAFFPGGLGERLFAQNAYLAFEVGPSVDVRLQWGTYFDAADQAGQSRLYGGIHVVPDDYDGRITGQAVGEAAAARVRTLYGLD
ncbi:MAG: vanadium-dependent haloperoxidase [Myxococcota bacterium]